MDEIIRVAKCVIFFVDDDQAVTLRDIGRQAELHRDEVVTCDLLRASA